MNSSLNNRRNRRYYTKESFLDKTVAFLHSVFAWIMFLLESIYNFFSRPETVPVIKAACALVVLVVIVGTVGQIESRTILFGEAIVRILGALAVACVVFKAIGD